MIDFPSSAWILRISEETMLASKEVAKWKVTMRYVLIVLHSSLLPYFMRSALIQEIQLPLSWFVYEQSWPVEIRNLVTVAIVFSVNSHGHWYISEVWSDINRPLLLLAIVAGSLYENLAVHFVCVLSRDMITKTFPGNFLVDLPLEYLMAIVEIFLWWWVPHEYQDCLPSENL